MGELKGLPTREVEPYVTKRELAAEMHVSVRTIEKWMSDMVEGRDFERWGPRIVRFQPSKVLRWLRERGEDAA